MKTCSIEDCSDRAVAKGWCNPHYQRWYRYGDPLIQLRIRNDDDRRFWSKVDKTPANGCWLWTDNPGTLGYCQVRMGGRGGKFVLVHRWAYEHVIGPIPKGLTIDHTCHNDDLSCPGGADCMHRRCVNPEHLEAVTQRVNTQRRAERERIKKPCAGGPVPRRESRRSAALPPQR